MTDEQAMSQAYCRARALFGDAAYVAVIATVQDHTRTVWLEVGTKRRGVGTRRGAGKTWDEALRNAALDTESEGM